VTMRDGARDQEAGQIHVTGRQWYSSERLDLQPPVLVRGRQLKFCASKFFSRQRAGAWHDLAIGVGH
jgi:hypothetical protein